MSDALSNFRHSGKILIKAMNLALELIKPGAKLLDIAEEVEMFIRSQNAIPAFPVNISTNEIAAHYSPIINDEATIPDKSLVKVDLGVAYNGYPTDCARTISFEDKYHYLVSSAQEALNTAIQSIKPNISVYKIGKIIENTINKSKLMPISNLSGHSLEQYSLHSGISVPNVSLSKLYHMKDQKFYANRAYAIEPFTTTGKGVVKNGKEITIFRLKAKGKRKGLSPKTLEIQSYILKNFYGFPFTERWLYNQGFSEGDIKEALEEFLLISDTLVSYPVLIEVTNSPVAQAEDTIYVHNDRVEIITRE